MNIKKKRNYIIGLILLIFIVINIIIPKYLSYSADAQITSIQNEIQNLITNNCDEFEEFSSLLLSEYINVINTEKDALDSSAIPISNLFRYSDRLRELAILLNCDFGAVMYDEDLNILCRINYPERIKCYDFFIFPIYKTSVYFDITIVLEDNDKSYTFDERYDYRYYLTNSPDIYIFAAIIKRCFNALSHDVDDFIHEKIDVTTF